MNVKMLIAGAVSSLLLGSFANAQNFTMLVDDMMSLSGSSMSGVSTDPNGVANGNIGAMSGTNDMNSNNNAGGNGMSGVNSTNNNSTDDGSADTATGDNDY